VDFVSILVFLDWAQFTSPQIELPSDHSLCKVTNQKAMNCQDGAVHSEFTNIGGDHIQLLLEWGLFTWLVFERTHDLALAGKLTDNNAHEPSLASLDLST